MAYDLNILQSQLQDLSRQYQQLANNQPVSSYAPQAQPVQIPVPVPARQVQYVDGLQGARLYHWKNNEKTWLVQSQVDSFTSSKCPRRCH